jgi:uridine kinase
MTFVRNQLISQQHMGSPAQAIASQICKDATRDGVYLVGIDGPGASGKSLLANSIREQLEKKRIGVETVHIDDFYLPSASRNQLPASLKPIGGDFGWMRLRDQVLAPLRSGQIAKYVRYDWPSDQFAEQHEIQPRGIIIVEGVYCTRAELRNFYDFRIWVECPPEVRLGRGLARDGESARSTWVNEWMPAESRYANEHRPSAFAHVIVDGAVTEVSRNMPNH